MGIRDWYVTPILCRISGHEATLTFEVSEQPRSQFLLMGFHFSNLLLYEHALKSKTARAQESVVSEMVRHSTAILNLAMGTVDERTRKVWEPDPPLVVRKYAARRLNSRRRKAAAISSRGAEERRGHLQGHRGSTDHSIRRNWT